MRVTCVVAALAALVMVAADEAKPPPFNKEELEGIASGAKVRAAGSACETLLDTM